MISETDFQGHVRRRISSKRGDTGSVSNTFSMHFDVFPAFAALFLQADNIISMESPTQLSFTNWDIGIIRITPGNGN